MKKLKKLFFVVLGSFIIGFGISLTIAVNLGSDPMTLFWIGIANQLHITVGQANLLVCAVLLFIVFFFDRHQIHVGSIINPIAIAIVTDWLAFMDLQSLSYGGAYHFDDLRLYDIGFRCSPFCDSGLW